MRLYNVTPCRVTSLSIFRAQISSCSTSTLAVALFRQRITPRTYFSRIKEWLEEAIVAGTERRVRLIKRTAMIINYSVSGSMNHIRNRGYSARPALSFGENPDWELIPFSRLRIQDGRIEVKHTRAHTQA